MTVRVYLSMIRPRGGEGGGAFVYPLQQGLVGQVIDDDYVITAALDLGEADAGPEHWLQATHLSVKAGQTISLPVILRPGVTGLVPEGRINDVDFTGYAPLVGELPGSLGNAPDFGAFAPITGAVGTQVDTYRLWHAEGAFYDLVVTSVKAPDIFSVAVNTAPAGLLTAFKPGDVVSLTVSSADSADMDKVFIGGVLAYEPAEPAPELTFDWTVPAVALQGQDPLWPFDITAQFASLAGVGGTFTLPIQVPALLGQTLRVEDYPGSQLALKGTESVVMTGRLQTPNTGAYTFSAVPGTGFTVSAESYTPVDGDHTDYSVTLARTTGTEGLHNLQFSIAGVASGMAVTAGTHQFDVQLSAPTIAFQLYRLKFGTGTNTVTLRSNKRLMTRPVMTNFTATTETAVGSNWDYAYTRADIAVPAGGETAGISADNTPTVTTAPVGGSGITGATVDGTYKLYGWFGTFTFNFTTPYVKVSALSSVAQQALVDPGTITATSNASDTPTWALCNSSGTVTALPAATHIKITNAEIENNSGTANLVLTST